jgi:hypothetical protein
VKAMIRDYEVSLMSAMWEPEHLEQRVEMIRRKLSEPRDEMYLSLGQSVEKAFNEVSR